MLLFGYSGHNFLFHTSAWWELRQLWLAGQPASPWDSHANFTRGQPRFAFYPPFSLMLGGLLGLLLPLAALPAIVVWLILLTAGFCMYVASSAYLPQKWRLLASVLYMVQPYLLTTALVRFDISELCVQACLPLVLWSFCTLLTKPAPRVFACAASLLSLCWLTNVPASIVLLYSLLITAALCAVLLKSLRGLLLFCAAELMAGALASFYLLPARLEERFIHSRDILDYDFHHFFLFSPVSYFYLKLFNLSCWGFACAGILVVALCVLSCWRSFALRQREGFFLSASSVPLVPLVPLVLVAVIAFAFELRASTVLWQYLPRLAYVQFPFRFTALLGAVVPLLLFQPGISARLRNGACAGLVALACIPVYECARAPGTAPRVTMTALADLWSREGYKGVPEFVPAGATRSPSFTAHPLMEALPDYPAGATCQVALHNRSINNYAIEADCPRGGGLMQVAQSAYPYWQAQDETGAVVQTASSQDGLLRILLPPGRHIVTISMKAFSRARTWSDGLSIAALFCLLCLSRHRSGGEVTRAEEPSRLVLSR